MNKQISKPLVLIADDNAELLSLFKHQMQNAPFDVLFARDGHEAIEIYKHIVATGRRLDVAVLDYEMPHKKGDAVFAAISEISEEKHVDPPFVIILTASNDFTMLPRLRSTGAWHMILKRTSGGGRMLKPDDVIHLREEVELALIRCERANH